MEADRGTGAGIARVDAPTYRAWQADPHGTPLNQEMMTRTSLAIGILLDAQNAGNW
jgi:hypothetical protein